MNCRTILPYIALTISLVTLTACNSAENNDTVLPEDTDVSGEGDTNTESTGDKMSQSGRVADGYLVGATVCLDLNGSYTCELNEPTALSESGGLYELDATEEQLEQFRVIVIVGPDTIDEDTGVEVGRSYTLTSPVDNKAFISPLTSMLQAAVENDPGVSVSDKKRQLAIQLGLDPDEELLYQDYVMESSSDPRMQSAYFLGQLTARIMSMAESSFKADYESETGSEPSPAAARAFSMVLQGAMNEQLPGVRSWVDLNNPSLPEIEDKASEIYSAFSFSNNPTQLVALVHAHENKIQALSSPIKQLFEAGYSTMSGMEMNENKCFSGDLNRIGFNADGNVERTHDFYNWVLEESNTKVEGIVSSYDGGVTIGEYLGERENGQYFDKMSFNYAFNDDRTLTYSTTFYDHTEQVLHTDQKTVHPRFYRRDISGTPVYEWLVLSNAQQGFMDHFNYSGLNFPEGSEVFYVSLGIDSGPRFQWFEKNNLSFTSGEPLTDLASHQAIDFELSYLDDDESITFDLKFGRALDGEYGSVTVGQGGSTQVGSYRFSRYEGEPAFVIDPAFARNVSLPFYVFGADPDTSDQDSDSAIWMATDVAYVRGARMQAKYAMNDTAYNYLWGEINNQRSTTDCTTLNI